MQHQRNTMQHQCNTMQHQRNTNATTHQVAQTLSRVGRVRGLAEAMRPIVGCAETYGYRNKACGIAVFSFADCKGQNWTVGLGGGC
jgi:phage-related protein